MCKVVLEGFIVVPDHDLQAVVAELPNHTKLTLNESGCIVFEVTERKGHPCIFDVREEFADESAFEFHQSRIKGTKWANVTAGIERHYKIKRLYS